MNFKIFSVLFFILLITAFFMQSCKDKASDVVPEIGRQPGQYLPEFTLENEKGETVSLSDFKGKTVLIEFWASWCSYCNAEAPKMNALYSDFKNNNFEIIGISIDVDKSAWTYKVNQHDHQYVQLNDPLGWNSPLVTEYDVKLIPKMFLVDEDGKVIFVATRTDNVREVLQQRFR